MQNCESDAHHFAVWKLVDEFLGVPEDEQVDLRMMKNILEWKKLDNPPTYPYPYFDPKSDPPMAPALPLAMYEGVYTHPAYDGFSLSLTRPKDWAASYPSFPPNPARNPAWRPLYFSPSEDSHLNMSGIFHHVSGEYWLAHTRVVPKLDGAPRRAQFKVGVEGEVEGLWLQAERVFEEGEWFEK
jgi:hypothetical protein